MSIYLAIISGLVFIFKLF